MDAFSFLMSITLATAGLFLARDYARFLKGSYAMAGRVKAIQQVFRVLSENEEEAQKTYVPNGFYPVIEYEADGVLVSFTAIDRNASAQLHVGDTVQLRITKSRRRANRGNSVATLLVTLLSALCLGLTLDALLSQVHLSITQVVLASLTVAISLAVLVVYVRDKDDYYIDNVIRTSGGHIQLSLFEPTAFQKWQSALRDPNQNLKIRSSQAFGATCMCAAMVMLAVAIEPLWRFSL